MSNLKRVDFVNKTVLPEERGGHMADLSNGYTKVANEIQQLKPRLRMSGREWQCFEAVIWLTYGWNKKQDRVTNTVIAELTGLSDTHVSDAIKALAERKIIFNQKQGMMKLVGVNTELSGWILDKPETGRKFPKTGKSLPKSGKTFPKTVATQYKNKNSNKTSTSENSDESSDSHGKKLPVLKPDAAIQSGAKWGTSEDLRCAEWLFAVVRSISSSAKQPNYAAWSNDIRLMRERDNRTHKEIATLFKWACEDKFWKGNVLCPSTLREKWTQLDIKRGKQSSGQSTDKPRIDLNNTDWIYGVQL
ncbi:TPA: replication protein [Citrobacter freundii]|uniref:replication protein n=1 Tax=Citrobacter freundii TaxID=546 RepID=UPI001D1114C9|nr:replication protein [Citrobacter freundii]MCC2939178.1 replication protein [Citrobacter freundii]